MTNVLAWEPPGTDWEPGDPLYAPDDGRLIYANYLYNFRDDQLTEDCQCGDAAVWTADPDTKLPPSARPLTQPDEFEAFIVEHRAWVADGSPSPLEWGRGHRRVVA